MKNHEKSETITKAIAANIEALAQLLEDAMVSACEAQEAMSKNEQNKPSAASSTSTASSKTRSRCTAPPSRCTAKGVRDGAPPSPRS